ncbi:hypothetical protein [Sphingomonas sp. 3-13AW]|uniref:hypothetical protein n=1 Tax=Sphingomonas sp. 3-13AW TaxID=3050450 RepID=UPI003BB5B0E6
MLVKLPASVRVETNEEALAALNLVVQFAQETYGGRAVFAARMDRDERSLNSVDLFLAPRYLKVTKRNSKEAVSLTRFGKLLAVKHGIKDRSYSARGSMQAQGTALQNELADWFTDHGYEAQRGVPKKQNGDDWKTPEVMGARKDREVTQQLIDEQVPRAMEQRRKSDQLLADAERVRAEAEVEADDIKRRARADANTLAAEIRAQAEAEAAGIRSSAKAEADRLAKAIEDREQRLADDQRAIVQDRRQIERDRSEVTQRMAVTHRDEKLLAERKAQLLADAERIKAEAAGAANEIQRRAQADAHALATEIRAQAEAEALGIRGGAKAEVDRLTKAIEDREQRLADDQRAVAHDRRQIERDRNDVKLRTQRSENILAERKAELTEYEAKVVQKATLLSNLIAQLESILPVVTRAYERLQGAPKEVRLWLEGSEQVGAVVKAAGPHLEEGRKAIRALTRGGPKPSEIDIATQAAFLNAKRERGD